MKEVVAGMGHLLVVVFFFHFSLFMTIPVITDVTMAVLCPGQDQCSLAIYLAGFQQAIVGLGSLLMTPILGNLSDKYGRKTILAIPMTVFVIPQAILAYGQSRSLFFAYYGMNTISSIICQGTVQSLTLAYVADKFPEKRRASAFGILTGVSAGGFVFGNALARFIPTVIIFRVSAGVGFLTAAYMKFFLDDSLPANADLLRPIIATTNEGGAEQQVPVLPHHRKVLLPWDMLRLVRSSPTFTHAALITFLGSFGESGLRDCLLFFLKSQFHFDKNQFADLLLITGVAGAFSQLVLTPILVPAIGEAKLLSMALLATTTHIFLYSIAWASWVPYFAAMFTVAGVFSQPCLRSIVSKKFSCSEQGMVQGCISGVSSFANIFAPVVVTPLTALFLSENPPFYFPGFGIMCIGFVAMASFVQSIIMMTAETDSPVLNYKVDCLRHAIP